MIVIKERKIHMFQTYEKARILFGIKNGFVEEQIEDIYAFLKDAYSLENLEHLSAEYFKVRNKKLRLERAYSILKSPVSHYFVNTDFHLLEEQMVEEISKLIYDYRKKEKTIDKYFIAKLVEIMVSAKGLHQYITDIEFQNYSKDYVALYDDRTLKVYKESIDKEMSHFILGNNQYSYYKIVAIIRHEIEHARQEKIIDSGTNTIEAQLLKICFSIFPKYKDYFEHLLKLPLPIFLIVYIIITLYSKKDYNKYIENWEYAPQERIAEIKANALVLTLLEQEKQDLKSIQNVFESDTFFLLLQGYDKPLGPTEFYFSELGLREKWKNIQDISWLTLEEKLLFGLPLTSKELGEAKREQRKVLSAIQKIC